MKALVTLKWAVPFENAGVKTARLHGDGIFWCASICLMAQPYVEGKKWVKGGHKKREREEEERKGRWWGEKAAGIYPDNKECVCI